MLACKMGHVSALDPLTAGTEDCLVERGSSARQKRTNPSLHSKELFNLYVLFCHFRSRDSTTENYFHAHINAYLMKRQKTNSLESITWSELGKQSIKAKKFNRDLKKLGGSSPPGPASKMLAKASV